MSYGDKLPSLDKVRNRMRREAAIRCDSDIYVDTKGRPRYSRDVKAGQKLVVSNGEHKNLITKLLSRA